MNPETLVVIMLVFILSGGLLVLLGVRGPSSAEIAAWTQKPPEVMYKLEETWVKEDDPQTPEH